MRNIFSYLLLTFSLAATAQSSTGPSISNAGTTLQNYPLSLEVNFTFASPFGTMVYDDNANAQLIAGIPAQNIAIVNGEASTVGIEDFESTAWSSVEMFFNPSSQEILFRGETIEDFEGDLMVFDVQGKQLFKTEMNNGFPVMIEIPGAQSLFIVSLVKDQQVLVSRKFISQP